MTVVWHACRLALALAVVLGAAAPVGAHEERFRLRETYAVGDVAVREASSRVTLSILTRVGDQESTSETGNESRRTYRETVLALDAKGKPASVRRTYSVARTVDRAQGEVKDTVSPLQGKTITVTRTAGKVQVACSPGTLSPTDTAEAQQALDGNVNELYPVEPVAQGERWTTSSPAMARMIGPGATCTVTGTVEEKVAYGGHPCLRVRVEVEVTGTPAATSMKTRFVLEGDMFYATDLRRTLALDVKGPVTVNAELHDGGQPMRVTGLGQVEVKLVSRMEKVGK